MKRLKKYNEKYIEEFFIKLKNFYKEIIQTYKLKCHVSNDISNYYVIIEENKLELFISYFDTHDCSIYYTTDYDVDIHMIILEKYLFMKIKEYFDVDLDNDSGISFTFNNDEMELSKIKLDIDEFDLMLQSQKYNL